MLGEEEELRCTLRALVAALESTIPFVPETKR
jgi:hypothetical protein